MRTASGLMLATAIMELILGIPILGGAIVMLLFYIPLLVMLVLHIIALVFAAKEQKPKAGNILGIVTSCLAWIPFVGMLLHLATAIVLFATYFSSKQRSPYHE